MAYTVYVLRSLKDHELYIGMTDDLEDRLRRHQKGYVRSTHHRRPFQLLHEESYAMRAEAAKRERFLKSGAGHTELTKILRQELGHSKPESNIPD